MGMTLEEAMDEENTVSTRELELELAKHGITEFLEIVDCRTYANARTDTPFRYSSRKILQWLGY